LYSQVRPLTNNIIHIVITKKGNQEQTVLKILTRYLPNKQQDLPMGVPWLWGFPWGFQRGFLWVWDGYGD